MVPSVRRFANMVEAERADREASWALTPNERLAILRALRERVYGSTVPGVRADRAAAVVKRP